MPPRLRVFYPAALLQSAFDAVSRFFSLFHQPVSGSSVCRRQPTRPRTSPSHPPPLLILITIDVVQATRCFFFSSWPPPELVHTSDPTKGARFPTLFSTSYRARGVGASTLGGPFSRKTPGNVAIALPGGCISSPHCASSLSLLLLYTCTLARLAPPGPVSHILSNLSIARPQYSLSPAQRWLNVGACDRDRPQWRAQARPHSAGTGANGSLSSAATARPFAR
ncbi:hypothetical protein M011DRAFT_246765 [Sporormia fimetaria CBS 119925]|uniref:Uncharacterized protein n=1 Tax=Sporormia fimetaria CBS 119925 TaxID=1340428 RepID=A0A6A6UZZ3_9PLEO|nr:hypothetical protein M011DRAFT_246765 [Sporormia fimetaria CBS 119925]